MIRTAEYPRDYKAVKGLIAQGVEEGSLQPRKKKDIKKSMKHGRTVVAEQESQIIGTASVTVYDRRIGELRSLYVAEPYRGNGLGTALINGILEQPISVLPSATIFAITSTPQAFHGAGFDTGFKTNTSERHIRMKRI